MIIILPIYYEIKYKTKKSKTILIWLNWYRNRHFFTSNDVKHHFHKLISEQVKDIKFKQIKLKYKVYMKTRKSDYMNIRSIIEKFALDWLVENGNIENDTLEYVLWDLWCEVFIDKDNPRCEIEIIKI